MMICPRCKGKGVVRVHISELDSDWIFKDTMSNDGRIEVDCDLCGGTGYVHGDVG